MKIEVGEEVLSHCNKCKLNLAHIIATMKKDGSIGKVQCKTCDAVHAYKDPSKVKAKKVKNKMVKRKVTTEQSISEMWLEALNKSTSKSQPYSINGSFTRGDIIDHDTFGPGIIDRAFDGNKIEVIFRHEIKILIHNV